MDLSVGDRLGRFEILGPLGAGGMGDVYRARDPRLQREVAIKVLPAAFSSDPERHRRFEQEARAAGSLSHPNIVAVYDVGVHEGSLFIVTELLEGETLRQRMNGRALAPRTAVDYAIEIAGGLAAGHERGIVHRDVKPENLFVTRDGRIKILDFGLARLTGPDVSGDVTATLIDGVPLAPVMGTAAYMSPEQARGLRTDHRTDIFSLGVLLYEMVAGPPLFRRGTMADTLSAVLNDDPRELSSLVPVERALERIVGHCVEKDPGKRFQSARDLIFALEALPHTTGRTPATPLRGRTLSKTSAGLAYGILAISSAVALGYLAGNRALPTGPSTAYTVDRVTDIPGLEEFPAISPARSAGGYYRYPRWSPDRKRIAFQRGDGVRYDVFVVLAGGGEPRQLTQDRNLMSGLAWLPDSTGLVYGSSRGSTVPSGGICGTSIWALSTATGAWRQVTDFGDRAISIARRVSWSADGKSIVAAVGEGDADIVLLDGLIKVR